VIVVRLCAGAAFLVCLAVVLVRRRLLIVTIHGTSMEPTFRSGDRVLVRRTGLAAVRVGDVVIVGQEPGGVRLIKRAAAIPGDPVPRERFAALAQVAESTVPEGKLVVLGDNAHSADSRLHGYYDGDLLTGVVVRKLRGAVPQGSVPVVAGAADSRPVRATGRA